MGQIKRLVFKVRMLVDMWTRGPGNMLRKSLVVVVVRGLVQQQKEQVEVG